MTTSAEATSPALFEEWAGEADAAASSPARRTFRHTKSLKRHKWVVWLYTSQGRPGHGPDVPIRKGTIVTSRRKAKRLADMHARKRAGNQGVWCRWSYNIRGRDAEKPYIQFCDLVTQFHLHDGTVNRVLAPTEPEDFALLIESEYVRERYRRAAANPHIIGERRSEVFRSVTVWQAEDYNVEVKAGFFPTRNEAEEFGRQPLKLVRDIDRLVLLHPTTGEEIATADDESVEVSKLRASSRGKLMLDYRDFEPCRISIADFERHPDLSSFGSLAYGVAEIRL